MKDGFLLVFAKLFCIFIVIEQGTPVFHGLLVWGIHRPDAWQDDTAVFARRIDIGPCDDLHVHLQVAALTVEGDFLDACFLRREVEALVAVLVTLCKELQRILREGGLQRARALLLADADAEPLAWKDPHRLVQYLQFGSGGKSSQHKQ